MVARRSMLLAIAACLFAFLPIQACRSSKEPGKMVDSSKRPPLVDVLARHSAKLMAIDGVAGTYEGRTEDGQPCIKVMVIESTDALRDRIPQNLEGYAVLLHETGEIGPVDNK